MEPGTTLPLYLHYHHEMRTIMKIPLIKPNFSEEEARAVAAVIRSSWINEGEKVSEFEHLLAKYLGVKHVVAFFNGTVALHAALLALGIGPGDEVIVPSFTFFSTVSSVVHVGATPVFADISPDTFGLDPESVSRQVSAATKAIMPVHYGGLAVEMDPITDLAKKHGIIIIEDAAESLGAEYRGKKAGTLGRVGMFSFTPTKIITTAEGGILATDDDELDNRLRLLKNHGQDHLYHHVCFGFNYRMTEMQAALGICQFGKLPQIIRDKRRVAARMSAGLAGIKGLQVPHAPAHCFHTYMLFTICLASKQLRDMLYDELHAAGITVRIYFPPVHRQPVFASCGIQLPITERIGDTVLSLPCYASMRDREMEYMIGHIKRIMKVNL